MRVSVSHTLGQAEAQRRIEKGLDDIMGMSSVGPVSLRNVQKEWQGNKVYVSGTASLGLLKHHGRAAIEVTEREVIIEVDLPAVLTGMMGNKKIEDTVQRRVKGLLNPA